MATPLSSTGGVSAVSDFTEGWKQDAYVGYSIYCETAAEMQQNAAGDPGEYLPP